MKKILIERRLILKEQARKAAKFREKERKRAEAERARLKTNGVPPKASSPKDRAGSKVRGSKAGKKILITSTQYPHYGGAATNAYMLIKKFKDHGIKVAGVFFDNSEGNVDPDNTRVTIRHKNDSDTRKIIRSMLGGDPDIIFAKNYAAPVYSKRIFPKAEIVYLASGSPQMMKAARSGISAVKYLNSNTSYDFKKEEKAVKTSDYVLPNSLIGKKLLEKHYGKSPSILMPIDTSLAGNTISEGVPFADRKYDIAFICSNMDRHVKNVGLAREIFLKLKSKNKIAIGNNAKKYFNIDNTERRPLSPHVDIIEVLRNTKLVICTSYYDASPNIVREALGCGANILVSKNCGWSETYPGAFVCSDVYKKEDWIKRANILIKKKIALPSKRETKASYEDELNKLRRLFDV